MLSKKLTPGKVLQNLSLASSWHPCLFVQTFGGEGEWHDASFFSASFLKNTLIGASREAPSTGDLVVVAVQICFTRDAYARDPL